MSPHVSIFLCAQETLRPEASTIHPWPLGSDANLISIYSHSFLEPIWHLRFFSSFHGLLSPVSVWGAHKLQSLQSSHCGSIPIFACCAIYYAYGAICFVLERLASEILRARLNKSLCPGHSSWHRTCCMSVQCSQSNDTGSMMKLQASASNSQMLYN